MPDIHTLFSPAAQGPGPRSAHLVGNFDYTELLQSRGRGLFREYSRTLCLLMKEAKRPGPAPSIRKPGLDSWQLYCLLVLAAVAIATAVGAGILVSARIVCQYK
jgi:hypothetical protein